MVLMSLCCRVILLVCWDIRTGTNLSELESAAAWSKSIMGHPQQQRLPILEIG